MKKLAKLTLVNGVMVTQAEAKVKFVTLSTFTFRDGKLVDKDMMMEFLAKHPELDYGKTNRVFEK